MQVTGKIRKVFDTEKVSDITNKRIVIVDVSENPKYSQPVSFEVFDKEGFSKCAMLDEYNEGDLVIVHFNLRGRESKNHPGKYFNKLELWKITK